MAYRLKNKVVLITGASRGIGRASAIQFASKGAKIAITARDEDGLLDTKNELSKANSEIISVAADISNQKQVKLLVDKVVDKFGFIDILVNNAGRNLSGAIEDIDTTKLDYIFRLNVFGPLWLMQEVIPVMKRRDSGQIINVSSIAGRRGFPYGGGYCASKFALNGLTEAARVELAKYNINVSLVMPSGTNTNFLTDTLRCSTNLTDRENVSLMTPERVAARIVKVAENKRRSTIVGSKGRILLLLHWINGKFVDVLLKKIFKI